MPPSPSAWRTACWSSACTRSASPIPWSRWARRASARRCARRTRGRCSRGPPTPSPRRAASSASPASEAPMKALIKSRREPGIWLGDLPTPEPGPNDVLIRMRKTAICGTDIHIWQWDAWAARTIPVPMQVGHEYCGEIVALGSEVRGLAVGDRVSGEALIRCGHCRNCRAGRRHLCRNTQGVGVNRPGCFAEYMVLPASNVFRLPAGITDEIASILDPLGNATHAALSFNMVGEDVLITGAGPIGGMAVGVARFIVARHILITGVSGDRGAQ